MLLGDWLEQNGHEILPVDDPAAVEIHPDRPWHRIDPESTLSNVAVYGASELVRGSFGPTVIASICEITPEADPHLLLDRLADSALELPAWRRIARDARERTESTDTELIGEFHADGHHLASTTVASTWPENGRSMLFQVVVTTFHDQLDLHPAALRHAHPRRQGPGGAPTPRPTPVVDGPLNI